MKNLEVDTDGMVVNEHISFDTGSLKLYILYISKIMYCMILYKNYVLRNTYITLLIMQGVLRHLLSSNYTFMKFISYIYIFLINFKYFLS